MRRGVVSKSGTVRRARFGCHATQEVLRAGPSDRMCGYVELMGCWWVERYTTCSFLLFSHIMRLLFTEGARS